MAATSLADSTAAFEKQAANLGLDDDSIQGLKRMGIKNLGGMAFACGQPGTPVAEADVRTLLNQAVPLKAITVGDVVIMKRLIFEAQTSMVALSRAQADPSADPSLRKMPTAERAARLTAQRTRPTGLDLQGPLEVARSVYDLVNGMVEADALKYVPPAKCVTRMQEITATKPPKELKLDASGSGILVKDFQSEQTCAVNTELDVMEAMTSRSLAFDAVGVADFETFVQCLFQMLRQPAPPGFKSPTVTQLLRADRQAFVKMQELTRDGIKPEADGTRPLDKILKELPQDHSVVYYMLPTPEAAKEKPQPKAKPEKPAWTPSPWKGNDGIQCKPENAAEEHAPKAFEATPPPGVDRDGDQAKIPQADASLAQTATTDLPLVTTDEMTAPFAVEFCSGTGGLTAQLRKAGLKSSFGVDHIVKAGNKAPIIKLDIATPEGEELARSYLKSPLCAYAHFGLPCGTSSRAREIELPGMKSAPAPLRDADNPDGKPDLPAKDAKRVAAANAFQSCMWGGQRPKRTTIATDMVELSSLACECDGQHTHLPWGYTPEGFATAAEVEYPLELCRQWAMLVAKAVEEKFHANAASLPSHPDKKARAQSMKQTRKSLAFMPDWATVDTVTLPQPPPFTVGTKLETPYQEGGTIIPQHSRILRISPTHPHSEEGGGVDGEVQVAFGVPWSEEGFILEALHRGHPANFFDGLSKNLKAAIESNAHMSADAIAVKREWFRRWTDRAFELREDEAKLHSKLPDHRTNILKGKRFLVLGEILEDLGYPDKQIVQDMQEGFTLVEMARVEGAIFHSTKSSGNQEVDAELCAKTLKEVDKGWLKELPGLPEDQGRVSRRFAVVQSEGKVRPIDNYTESQINDAVTITGRCTVDGVDTISAMGAELMKARRKKGRSTGLKGRSFDLKSAYRQLAVRDDSLQWSRLAVFCPEDRSTRCFQQYSLPFGAKASVVAFLRCARMIQWVAHHLDIATTCYFHDYVCMAPEELASNSERSFELLLDLLGWEFDRSGDKADEMSESVSALGVVFDLTKTSEGVIFVSNTEKRKVDISAQIQEVLTAGRLSASRASSLKGRLGLAEGQLFGRAIRRLINELGQHAQHPPLHGKLSPSTKGLRTGGPENNQSWTQKGRRRHGNVMYLFTDASFNSEARDGGLGAVLLDQGGHVVRWFGCAAPRDLCESFMAEEQEQAIGELEALAVLVALRIWKPFFESKHLIVFLDNEGSRYLILKGYAANKVLESITLAWYARVPTEANIADSPSRLKPHPLLLHLEEAARTDQDVKVIASCPEWCHDQMTDVCSRRPIVKAFGKKGDYVDALDGDEWYAKWQARVVQAVTTSLQHVRKCEEVKIICIEGGPHCDRELAKIPDLKRAVCKEMEQLKRKVRVKLEWMSWQDFETEEDPEDPEQVEADEAAAAKHDNIAEAVKWGDLAAVRGHLRRDRRCLDQLFEGTAALHLAAQRDRMAAIVAFLLAKGAAVDVLNGAGRTPLHDAAWNGSVESAKLLLAVRASVDIKDNKGWGPQPMSPFRLSPATANVLQFNVWHVL
eukprot:s3100_g14.t1